MSRKAQRQPEALKARVAAYGRYSCDLQSESSAEDQLTRIRHSVKNGLIPGRNPADLELLGKRGLDKMSAGGEASRPDRLLNQALGHRGERRRADDFRKIQHSVTPAGR